MSDNGILAYDGSNNPPKRDLTARERDILVRLLSDVLYYARNNPPEWVQMPAIPFGGWKFGPVPIRHGEDNFLDVLREIRHVIDPREGVK